MMRLVAARRRNVVLVVREGVRDGAGPVDIWWRGGNANGAFMLALAYLLRQHETWAGHPLRVNMIVDGRSHVESEAILSDFLRRARVEAETRIIDGGGAPFTETIAANSADAAVSFVGLRAVSPTEQGSAFGDYVHALADGLSAVPCPVFALAGEDVDFGRIFT